MFRKIKKAAVLCMAAAMVMSVMSVNALAMTDEEIEEAIATGNVVDVAPDAETGVAAVLEPVEGVVYSFGNGIYGGVDKSNGTCVKDAELFSTDASTTIICDDEVVQGGNNKEFDFTPTVEQPYWRAEFYNDQSMPQTTDLYVRYQDGNDIVNSIRISPQLNGWIYSVEDLEYEENFYVELDSWATLKGKLWLITTDLSGKARREHYN